MKAGFRPVCGRVSGAPDGPPPARFTLVELLVVIAILGLLAGLLVPATFKARRQARLTACVSQLHQIGIAVINYTTDFEDRLPMCSRLYPEPRFRLPSLRQALTDYLAVPDTFQCPADRGSPSLFADCGTSYEWNTLLSGRQVDRATMRVAGLEILAPMLGDGEPFHGNDGRNYLAVDGRVSRSLELLIREH